MKKIISNQYIFSLLTKAIHVLLGVLSSVFINRFLGPSLKGEYSYLLNIINMSVLILNLGIYQSYPYFKRRDTKNIKNKFFNIFLVQFIVYVILGTGLYFVSRSFSVAIIFTLIPLMILRKQLNFIALVENVNCRNKINVGNQLFYVVILAIIYFFAPIDLKYAFGALYIKDILMIIRIIHRYKFRLVLSDFDLELMIRSIKYGILPMLSVLLITMNYNLDTFILRFYVDYEKIGYYSVGVTLANQVWLIPDAFKDVLFAKTARKNCIEDLLLSIKINIYIGVITASGIVLFGEKIINILYGSHFLDSYIVTIVIVVGLIPMIIFKFINTLFVANGKQKISFFVLLASVVLNIIMNIILIPFHGIVGAAVASVFSYSLCGVLFLNIFKKEFKVKWKDIFIINKQEYLRFRNLLTRR